MSTHRDKQPKNLHAYMGQGLERALEELGLTEEYVALRFFGFELGPIPTLVSPAVNSSAMLYP